MVEHVELQGIIAIKRLSALVAFEQLLFRVYNLGMLGEVAFEAEGHIALITFESLRRGMLRSLVLCEGLLRFKLFRAPVALGLQRLRCPVLTIMKIKIALVLVGLVALGAL